MAIVGKIRDLIEDNKPLHTVDLYDFDPATMDVVIVAKDARRLWIDNTGGKWGWSFESCRHVGLSAPKRQYEFIEVSPSQQEPFPWGDNTPGMSPLWHSELVHQ